MFAVWNLALGPILSTYYDDGIDDKGTNEKDERGLVLDGRRHSPSHFLAKKERKKADTPTQESKRTRGWEKDRVPTCTSRPGFWKDDQGNTVNTGAGSASRHGERGWAGFTHATGDSSLSYRGQGCTRRHGRAGAGAGLLLAALP